MSNFLSDLLGTMAQTFRVGRATLDASGVASARTHALPDKSGTVALVEDITSNIDGGHPDSVYAPTQKIDCGFEE